MLILHLATEGLMESTVLTAEDPGVAMEPVETAAIPSPLPDETITTTMTQAPEEEPVRCPCGCDEVMEDIHIVTRPCSSPVLL